MGIARVQVAAELVRDALHFPADAEIVGAAFNVPLRRLVLLVRHEDLPELPDGDGAVPLEVWPSYATRRPLRADWDRATRLYGDCVIFVGWATS